MKTKIAGIMVLLAGSATVFAATHASLENKVKPSVLGVADLIQGIENGLNLDLEIVGLEPNSQYVAKLENTTCSDSSSGVSVTASEPYVAAYIATNNFGSYSTVFKGLPASVENARSVAVYHSNEGQLKNTTHSVFCVDIM